MSSLQCSWSLNTSLRTHTRNFSSNVYKQEPITREQDIPAIRKAKYPLVIDREQAMINAIEAKLPNVTVLFCAFHILGGGTIPFHSVLFQISVTTFARLLQGMTFLSLYFKVFLYSHHIHKRPWARAVTTTGDRLTVQLSIYLLSTLGSVTIFGFLRLHQTVADCCKVWHFSRYISLAFNTQCITKSRVCGP